MADKLDKIRRRIEARRKELQHSVKKRERSQPQFFASHDEARDEPDFYLESLQRKEEADEKFFRKDIITLQILASICLFLVVGILFKTQAPQFANVRQFVETSFEKEFEFATVANWYEQQFGKPLALLPEGMNIALDHVEREPEEIDYAYAVPASGHVTRSFSEDGKGVIVQTNANSLVEAARGGMVRFVGEEESLGKTVIISHYDGGESWYAMLDKIEVKLYDHIKAGNALGTVSLQEGNGFYYFALKEGETFINPIEVISFD